MRDPVLHSLLNPPEVEEAKTNAEVSGSGTIGGEVYAGTLGGAPSSLTVGFGCTYVASESVTMESSVSHLGIHSPAAAAAAAAATGDGLGDAAESPAVGGGGVRQPTGGGQLAMVRSHSSI